MLGNYLEYCDFIVDLIFYFVQVPCRSDSAETSLELFLDEIPAFNLVGKKTHIGPNIPFQVDADVQLVCKYLLAYYHKDDILNGIDKLFGLDFQPPIKFSAESDLPTDLCQKLLKDYAPPVTAKSKVLMKLFVQ